MYSSDVSMREVRRISRVCEDAVYGSLPGPLPVLRACFAHFDRRRGCLVAGECERSGGRGGLASDESITACCLPKTNWICWRSSRSERIPLETPSVAECLDLRLSVTSPIQQDQQRAEIFALLALRGAWVGRRRGRGRYWSHRVLERRCSWVQRRSTGHPVWQSRRCPRTPRGQNLINRAPKSHHPQRVKIIAGFYGKLAV